ncbi:MAG: acetoin dehydrogenase [Hadesarchaea archaeon YNP_N21]|jgi:pyruvate dehydrogenase E1 component beta subunit|nr:MAG: acetoin dehydrogenase [Hadesarchaea archaeon YNP_N21]
MARVISYREALNEALRQEMRRDPKVFLLGEDIGVHGGDFLVTAGLLDEFGEERVMDTPISETAIIGLAVGAAAMGLRPVAEIMFSDFFGTCMDQILNQLPKLKCISGGRINLPLVVRTSSGRAGYAGAQHSQSLEGWVARIPGLKVAVPSTPYDAKGLLISSIRDDGPVIFFENKMLYGVKGEVPEEEYTIPFGKADIRRNGEDVTIVATAFMVHEALEVANKLEGDGISLEIIDPRTLSPLDEEAIISSVKKTGRLIIAEEATRLAGMGSEIAALVAERALDYLDAPIKRVAAMDLPVPFSPVLENYVLPDRTKIEAAVREILG